MTKVEKAQLRDWAYRLGYALRDLTRVEATRKTEGFLYMASRDIKELFQEMQDV